MGYGDVLESSPLDSLPQVLVTRSFEQQLHVLKKRSQGTPLRCWSILFITLLLRGVMTLNISSDGWVTIIEFGQQVQFLESGPLRIPPQVLIMSLLRVHVTLKYIFISSYGWTTNLDNKQVHLLVSCPKSFSLEVLLMSILLGYITR